nr:hypothetical protein [uncultured Brevundimonas sp.]
MTRITLSILIVALAAGGATAQSAGPTPPPAAPAEAPQTAFTLDTPIEVLAADAGARAVLERELPGLIGHERFDQFKAMSLKALKPFSGDLITDERLAAVEAALAGPTSSSEAPNPVT